MIHYENNEYTIRFPFSIIIAYENCEQTHFGEDPAFKIKPENLNIAKITYKKKQTNSPITVCRPSLSSYFSNVKIGMYLEGAQRFNTAVCSWRLYDLPHQITLPEPVCTYLKVPGVYLAGGALISMLIDKPVKDYDLFFVGEPHEFAEIARNFNADHESRFALTKITKGCMIQLIKRVFNTPDQIIGGFDLDPCRFIYKHKLQTTIGGLVALRHQINYIDLSNASTSFNYRVSKYLLRGFIPFNIYDINGKYKNTVPLKKYDYISDFSSENDARTNAYFLANGQYDKLYIRDNTIYEFNDMISGYLDNNAIKQNYWRYKAVKKKRITH